MKIGIITFHFASNCGAVLQCLALSETLKRLGHEVEVINYRPSYHTNRYKALRNPFYFAKRNVLAVQGVKFSTFIKKYVKGFSGAIYAWRYYSIIQNMNMKFKNFVEEYLDETALYRSLSALKAKPPVCDAYICGSDQIWNTKLTNNSMDTAYLLDFGNPEVRRISYAAGVNLSGMKMIPEQYKKLLRNFQAISLREEYYYPVFKAFITRNTDIHIDLDPTLLLMGEDYERFMSKEVLEEEPYLLTYTMDDPSQMEVYKGAKELAEKNGLKIIDISNNPKQIYKKHIDSRICGPEEFLWYIKNARFVISNSYHSTVFALIFGTDFVSIPHSQTGYRVTELLDKIGLSMRYVNSAEEAIWCYGKKIEVEDVYKRIDYLKKESIDYLKEQLG